MNDRDFSEYGEATALIRGFVKDPAKISASAVLSAVAAGDLWKAACAAYESGLSQNSDPLEALLEALDGIASFYRGQ